MTVARGEFIGGGPEPTFFIDDKRRLEQIHDQAKRIDVGKPALRDFDGNSRLANVWARLPGGSILYAHINRTSGKLPRDVTRQMWRELFVFDEEG